MECSKEAQEAFSIWQKLQRRLSALYVILEEGEDRRCSAESEERVELRLGDTRFIKSWNPLCEGFKFRGETLRSFSMETDGPTSQFSCGEKW